MGYCLPFLSAPPLSNVPIPMPSSSPTSVMGAALEEVTLGKIAKGAVELAPLPSPGFYSHLLVVWNPSGSWRPVIDLSHLNLFVDVSPFQMVTIQSVLLSVRQGDWMASIDLKEASLQVPVPPASRHFLRFLFRDTVYHFEALCFGLSTAPQVFTRVMAPVSAILHSMGIRMRRYLDDWIVQSASRESLLRVLHPSQVVQCRGGLSSTPPLSGLIRRRSASYGCTHQPQGFQSCASPPASLWLSLLGVLASLAHLVPGGRLGMRFLQLCLHRSWDRQDLEDPVYASMECLSDLQWWLHLPRLSLGVSLCQVSPDLPFWSDASDVGWGAHLDRRIASGLWDTQQAAFFHKRQGTACCPTGSSPVPVISPGSHGGCILRQHHSGGFSSQGGWLKISSPHRLGSGVLALEGVPLYPPGSAVPPGLQQRPRGRPVSPSPAPTFRMVPNPDRLSFFEKSSAGPNRFICLLRQSSLFDLLLTFPGSNVSRHGRVSVVLGRSSGFRVPSGGHHSACSRDAQGLHGDRAHTSRSTLGPAPLVLRPTPAFAGSSSDPTGPSRPLALASVSSSFPDLSRLRLHAWRLSSVLQSRWILLRCSGAVFAGALSILARCISGTMVHLSCVVPHQWPFCLSSYLSYGS